MKQISEIENDAKGRSFIHRLHPIIKLLVTVLYLVSVLRLDASRLDQLILLFAYPIAVLIISDLPMGKMIKRVGLIEPFIFIMAIANPFFNRTPITYFDITMTEGWWIFFVIMIKSTETVFALTLLMSTTQIMDFAAGLEKIKVPNVLILIFLQTYRYIDVMISTTQQMMLAYKLRSYGSKGIDKEAWGSFPGQIFMRAIRHSEQIYEAMKLRGFEGEYYMMPLKKTQISDWIFVAGASLYFAIIALYL